MPNAVSITMLEVMENFNPNDIFVMGYCYPSFQMNGQRNIGPVRNFNHFGLAVPKEYEREIFINKIPSDWNEQKLMNLLQAGGIVYHMRFMVNFSGITRGYAYIQYLGSEEPLVIIDRLNNIFLRANTRITARVSFNFRRLKVGNVAESCYDQKLQLLFTQCKCIAATKNDNERSYVLTFRNNRDACLARRDLLSFTDILGPNPYVVWYDRKTQKSFN